MKNLLNTKILTILFFSIIFLLGLNSFQDYGVYFDNTFRRINALFWYDYVKSFVLEPGMSFANHLEYLIKEKEYVIKQIRLWNEKKLNLIIKKINKIELNCKKNHELSANITLDFLSTVCNEVNNFS